MDLGDGKILASIGQHKLHRKLVLFNLNWLLENSRSCDFSNGLDDWSAFNYKKGIKGHCAYDRIAGCKLVDNPNSPGKKCLLLKYDPDDTLVDDTRGAVWNFPMARSGEIKLLAKFLKGFKGAKLMLHDRWINPSDPNAKLYALFAFDLPESFGDGSLRSLTVKFDAEGNLAELYCGGMKIASAQIARKAPIGISYLHLQSLKKTQDAGMLVMSVSEEGR